MSTAELTKKISNSLKQYMDLEKAILFGSYASGNNRPDSDIDIAIVTKQSGFITSFEERIKTICYLKNMLIDIHNEMPIDILLYTHDEWKHMEEIGNPVVKEIISKGIEL